VVLLVLMAASQDPWHWKEKIGLTNLTGKPFILDMAPSVAARGKIYKALRRGEKIPSDWALDRDGNMTDDPASALEGVMLPMGGPKGSALAIMMDVCISSSSTPLHLIVSVSIYES
jgi:LDH2 family malate/lactate/ureidoglycolate dehydrogenase